MKKVFTLLTLFFSCFLNAQPEPLSKTIHVNNIEALVNSNGSLFGDAEGGQFIPGGITGSQLSTILKSGIWIAGIDEASNLRGAVHHVNSDFVPGTIVLDQDNQELEVVDFNKIWRVTKEEIEMHKADFADNGVIDNPIQNIFAWPGRANQFFSEYNDGMTLPWPVPQGLAGFFDKNGTERYEPDQGDFPTLNIRACSSNIPIPDELFWFVYHDVSIHSESQMEPLNIEVQCQIFAFNCDENSPNGNTIYTSHKILSRSVEKIHDAYLGLYTDFNIGNGADDFFGCDPDRSLIFAYNGDENDEGGYGIEAPVMAVDVLRTPFKTFDDDLSFTELKAVLPIESMTPNNEPLRYYNLLQGLHPDGSTLPNDGLFYTDNPNDSDGWSEVTENNTPGDRKILSSFGPFSIANATTNEFIVAYTFYQEPGNNHLENLNTMYDQSDQIQSFFDNCFDINSNNSCSETTPTHDVSLSNSKVKIFPNPTGGDLNLQSNELEIKTVELRDINGRIVFNEKWSTAISNISLSLVSLPKGLYFLKLNLEKNEQLYEKIVIQ